MEVLVHITARAMVAATLVLKPMVYTMAIPKVPVSHKVSEVTALVPQDFVQTAYTNAKDGVLEVSMRKFKELFINYLNICIYENELNEIKRGIFQIWKDTGKAF